MIEYIHEPTDLQCGQAVLAMVLGKTVEEIVIFLQNDRETTLAEMKRTFREHGVYISDERMAVQKKGVASPLPAQQRTPRYAGTGRCTHTAHSTTRTRGLWVISPAQTENIIGNWKSSPFYRTQPLL